MPKRTPSTAPDCVLALRAASDARSSDPLRIMATALAVGGADPPETVFLDWLLSVRPGVDGGARRPRAAAAAGRGPP